MRSPRRAVAAVSLALALVLAAACSDDGPDATGGPTTEARQPPTRSTATHVGPIPVLAGAATTKGELTDGLPIAPGSAVLGRTFPGIGKGRGGFVALLVVTGDPVAVYNDYIDAAAALGMDAGGAGGCLAGFGSITCARRVVDPSDGEALSIAVERRPLDGGQFLSHAALRYDPPGNVDPADVAPDQPSPPTSALPPLALPKEVAGPAGGSWSTVVAPGGPTLDLADGTELAGPPGPCPCDGRGWSAVLHVDGDPVEALQAYAAQLGVDAPKVQTGHEGRSVVRVADLGLVPGGITQLRTVTETGNGAGDGGTWLLVAVSRG